MSVGAEAPAHGRQARVAKRDRARTERSVAARVQQGPLLAICGLVGGAGATTLAYLVALAAARQLSDPVLLADTGGPSGGLAELARVEAPRSLPELASDLAAGLAFRDGLYAPGPAGVRVLASGPDFTSRCPHQQLDRILADAREAHGLTVIDSGTLGREVDQVAAAAATHIAWLLPATEQGIRSGARVLEAAPAMVGKEIAVGRCDVRQPKASLRELRRIAAERRALLVLVPHLPALERRRIDRGLQEAQVALQAILGALSR